MKSIFKAHSFCRDRNVKVRSSDMAAQKPSTLLARCLAKQHWVGVISHALYSVIFDSVSHSRSRIFLTKISGSHTL